MSTPFAIGTRLYYTGDMANNPDTGTITAVLGTISYIVAWDSGSTSSVQESGIGPYAGHCHPRFSLLEDVRRFRAERGRRDDTAYSEQHGG